MVSGSNKSTNQITFELVEFDLYSRGLVAQGSLNEGWMIALKIPQIKGLTCNGRTGYIAIITPELTRDDLLYWRYRNGETPDRCFAIPNSDFNIEIVLLSPKGDEVPILFNIGCNGPIKYLFKLNYDRN